MLPTHEVKAALPNSIETNTGRLPKSAKKHGPNERIDQNSRKELNKREISNLSDSEFKTLVIRMLKEHSGYFNSIKMI